MAWCRRSRKAFVTCPPEASIGGIGSSSTLAFTGGDGPEPARADADGGQVTPSGS